MRADDTKTIPTKLFRTDGRTRKGFHIASGLGKPASEVAANGTAPTIRIRMAMSKSFFY